MIATRREFMKLSAAALSGMVLTRVATRATLSAGVVVSEEPLLEGRECPVPFDPGGDRFVQTLRSGDSILGPVLIYQWDVHGDSVPHLMHAKLVRPDYQLVLMRADLLPGCRYRWHAMPGAEIVVPERGEVVFKCSHVKGAGAVCFEKLGRNA